MLSAHFVLVFFQHFYREKLKASPFLQSKDREESNRET